MGIVIIYLDNFYRIPIVFWNDYPTDHEPDVFANPAAGNGMVSDPYDVFVNFHIDIDSNDNEVSYPVSNVKRNRKIKIFIFDDVFASNVVDISNY